MVKQRATPLATVIRKGRMICKTYHEQTYTPPRLVRTVLLKRVANGGQVDKDNVTERRLGVLRDAHCKRRAAFLMRDPFVRRRVLGHCHATEGKRIEMEGGRRDWG